MEKANRVTAPMYIVNPLKKAAKGRSARSSSLFSTHPATEDRIRILRSMAGMSDYSHYDRAYRKVTGSASAVIPKSALDRSQKSPKKAAKRGAPLPIPIPGISTDKKGALDLADTALPAAAAAFPEPDTPSLKVRETTNALWKSKQYRFIDCDCGVTLKVPASYSSPKIQCLRCSRTHQVSKS
jgi:heat shock protein HtpX